MIESVVLRKKLGQKMTTKASKLENRLKSTQNIEYTDHPDKEVILDKYKKIK